jgi:nitroimidazol reductase NimA-like FMN-containing flavoprotein (pyridoxamine 5'-phosphate oxidase superfamily)
MRSKDREITEAEKKIEIIAENKVYRLACPYIISPMSYR